MDQRPMTAGSAPRRARPGKAPPRAPAATPAASRTVLLAVTGMSPAILTETLWALSRENPPVIPDEVVVLTTTRGAEDLRNWLLKKPGGWPVPPWEALRRDILTAEGDPRLQLATPRLIELPNPRTGVKSPAADIRSAADNAAAADFLLEELRRLTENPDTRLIASIAGGRKTMGALLYAAMSLLGRETDRVTHVLVSEPYETCRGFFFPTQPVKSLHAADGSEIPAQNARIELADIPFVPLRNLFEDKFARRPGGFHALVAEASRKIDTLEGPPAVVLHTLERTLNFAGETARLNERETILALLLLQSAKQKLPPFPAQKNAEESLHKICSELRRTARAGDFSDWRAEAPGDWDQTAVTKSLHSLRKKLRAVSIRGARLAAAIISRGQLAWELSPEKIQIR